MHLSLSFNHYQHIANFISSNTLSTAPWTVTQQRPEIIPTVNISVSIIKRAVCAIKNIKNKNDNIILPKKPNNNSSLKYSDKVQISLF